MTDADVALEEVRESIKRWYHCLVAEIGDELVRTREWVISIRDVDAAIRRRPLQHLQLVSIHHGFTAGRDLASRGGDERLNSDVLNYIAEHSLAYAARLP